MKQSLKTCGQVVHNTDNQLEVTDEIIVEAVNVETENGEWKNDKISHIEGCKAIENVIKYLTTVRDNINNLSLLRRLIDR